MALQEILRQVEQAGQGEADAINSATAKEVAAILSEGKAEGEQVAADITVETQRKIEQLERQELPAAELEVKRARLDAQRQVLETTRQEALKRLNSLSSSELKQVYQGLLAGVPAGGTLRCRKADAKLLGKLASQDLGEPIDEAGFIIENDEYRLDFRFSTLVEREWQTQLPAVSEELFGK
ncbi:MAG: V-type ATP synthase subunit E family protein [Candidatus Thermoplasmatota archaeon]|nr:V-type ATP synthase subunit E family protein [Candidatus Thermoplasmatota archaeon]